MSTMIGIGFDSKKEISYFTSFLEKHSNQTIIESDGSISFAFDEVWMSIEHKYEYTEQRPKKDESSFGYHYMFGNIPQSVDMVEFNYKLDIIYYISQNADLKHFIGVLNFLLNSTEGNFIMWNLDDELDYLVRLEENKTLYVSKIYFCSTFDKLTVPFEVI